MGFKRKIAAFTLLLLVAIPLFFSIGFLIKQQLIQSQMRERIEQSSLQTITLPLANINWIKQDKEVIIEGKLFDIKSYTISGNSIILKGLFDGDEDHLITKVNNILHSKKDTNSPLSQLAAKYLSQPLFNEPVSFSIQKTWINISGTFLCYTEPVAKAHCFLAVPPPKFS
jgi:hypothetical protein